MQYEVKESGYGVTVTSAKFDVVITPEAPLNVAIGESARLEVPQAINYIKSGEAEIKAATDIGISRIGSTVTDGLNQFNANATAKTTAYNNNATDKLNAYNLNAQNLTTAFNTNAGDKTTAFNNNATAKINTYNDNATDKTTAFNNNATSKTGDFNDNFTDKLAAFDLNAGNKTTAFNNNASDKTTAFNDNAAIKQAAVDASADAAAASAVSAKQWAIGDPSEPTGNSAKYWANQAASSLSGLEAQVTTIESEIPAQASSSNQLADKSFVNSSIATNTANFIGTFNSLADLEAYSGTLTNNDYAFVISTDSAGNTVYNRYKWNGTAWLFEYALNNSSFTSNQWAAINSGATTANIGQITTKADDNAVVHLAGAETITGNKTFTGSLTIPCNTLIAKQDGNLEGGEIKFQRGDNDPLVQDPSIDLYNGNIRFLYCNSVIVTTPITSSNDETAASTAFVKNVLSEIYPVGSIYIGTMATCPLETLISGSTWELVAVNMALWGSDSNHSAGSVIAQGLPNIKGDVGKDSGIGHVSNVSYGISVKDTQCSGAFYPNNNCGYTATRQAQQGSDGKSLGFDASLFNPIYGASDRVQPPAYVVNIWRRTA